MSVEETGLEGGGSVLFALTEVVEQKDYSVNGVGSISYLLKKAEHQVRT